MIYVNSWTGNSVNFRPLWIGQNSVVKNADPATAVDRRVFFSTLSLFSFFDFSYHNTIYTI